MSEEQGETLQTKPAEKSKEDRKEHWRFLVPIFFNNALMSTTRMMFPVLYFEFIQYFEISVAAAGWIGSIQVGGAHFFGKFLLNTLNFTCTTYDCGDV